MEAFSNINSLLETEAFSTKLLSEIMRDSPMTSLETMMGLTDRFLPLAIPGEYGNAMLIQKSAAGIMAAYTGGQIAQTALPDVDQIKFNRQFDVAEQIVFSKKDLERMHELLRLMRMQSISEKTVAATMTLKRRFENRRADMVRQLINDNSLSIDSMGAYISASGIFGDTDHSKYHLTLTDTPETGYTDVRDLPGRFAFESTRDLAATGFYWDKVNGQPIDNLRKAITYIEGLLQRRIKAIHIPQFVIDELGRDSELIDLLKRHSLDRLVAQDTLNNRPLAGKQYLVNDATYHLQTTTTSTITLDSSSTFTVASANGISAKDYFEIEPTNNRDSYYGQVDSISGTTITLASALEGSGTIPAGSRLKIMKPIIDHDKIVFELEEKFTQWLATPNVFAGSEENPGYGYYARTGKSPDPRTPSVFIWAGYEGLLQVYKPNFVTMKVLSD